MDEGVKWPYWCGFELQTCKTPEPEKARSDMHYVPDGLSKLCKKEETGQDFVSVETKVERDTTLLNW